jgi:pimeloyl-ACP methyl ester carboxylesterase
MLHGWGQTLENLRPLGQRLRWHREVHLIDLPGFGQSPWPGQDWSTRDYALSVLSYMERAHIQHIALLGHSFGGRVALRIASEWPECVQSLVLVDSAGLPAKRNILQKFRLECIRQLGILFALLPGALAARLQEWHTNRYGSADYKNAGVLRGTFLKVVKEDQTVNAPLVKAPTLLLWGEHDSAMPVEIAYRFHQLIPNSQLVVLPGKGHFPFLDGGVHQCAQIVSDFLLENESHSVKIAPQR